MTELEDRALLNALTTARAVFLHSGVPKDHAQTEKIFQTMRLMIETDCRGLNAISVEFIARWTLALKLKEHDLPYTWAHP